MADRTTKTNVIGEPSAVEPDLRILLVEDIATDAELEIHALRRAGIACTTKRVENETDFRKELEEFRPDLIISDFSLPAFDGLSALRVAKEEQPDIPFIFVSGTIGEERAIESLKSGASDYVLKSNSARLPQAVLRAIREAEDRKLHKKQEQKIARLSRIHAVLSGINSAVIRIRDRKALFQEACAIAVKHGQFRMAWIGVPVPGSSKLTPIAWHGFNDGYLDDVGQELEKAADDHGIGGRALLEKRVIVANDIESDARVMFKLQALARGYRSLIALPLLVENRAVAVFLIYAADARIFDGEELSLLSELAGDISYALEYIEKEERLNYLAYYDVLTGLPNRNLLNDRLAQAISHSKRTGRMAAVAFIDLDHFKLINDSMGHNAGDHLLKLISKRLAGCLRDGDTIARLGGDEFVMVLPDQADTDAATQIMQRILVSASEPIGAGEDEFHTACSIGVALYPQDGLDV
jgi:diguanylate cyclase (GGDEF)-like protein